MRNLYLAENGTVKAKEKKLFGVSLLEQAATAPSFSGALALFHQKFPDITAYSNSIPDLLLWADNERTRLFEEAKTLAPDPLYRFLTLEHDFDNMRALCYGRNIPLHPFGSVAPELLFLACHEGKVFGIPDYLKPVVTNLFLRTSNEYHQILDREYLLATRNLLSPFQSPAITLFLRAETDLFNLFFRTECLEQKVSCETRKFLEGGFLPRSFFSHQGRLRRAWEKGYRGLPFPETTAEIGEVACAWRMSCFAKIRLTSFGIEPLFGYFLARKLEISLAAETLSILYAGLKPTRVLRKLGNFS
jgi:hypothetical protein